MKSKRLNRYDSKFWEAAKKTNKTTTGTRFLDDDAERQIIISITNEVKKLCNYRDADTVADSAAAGAGPATVAAASGAAGDSTSGPPGTPLSATQSQDPQDTQLTPTAPGSAAPLVSASSGGAGPSGTAGQADDTGCLEEEDMQVDGSPTQVGGGTQNEEEEWDVFTQQCSQTVKNLQEKLDVYKGKDPSNDVAFIESLTDNEFDSFSDRIARGQDAVQKAADDLAKARGAFELIEHEAVEEEPPTGMSTRGSPAPSKKKKPTKRDLEKKQKELENAKLEMEQAEALEKKAKEDAKALLKQAIT
jgi:hypothetical protein